ncbi:MAG: hypothetical protein P4L84_18350 [Isosphaeraceae bacterium]|nr:hypothetical protein [Isosphaeraceae bacterium]
MRDRHRLILIASTLLGSWLGMQAAHELGHVLGALVTGGAIARVVLYPLALSRTDLASNPWPLVVVCTGPLGGVLLPLGLWGLAAAGRVSWAFVPRFYAGFCLVANGAYIGCGTFAPVGDAQELLHHGAPTWLLGAFGAVAVPAGLWLWNGQGGHFGLGPARTEVRPGIAYACAGVCVALLVLGFAVDGT